MVMVWHNDVPPDAPGDSRLPDVAEQTVAFPRGQPAPPVLGADGYENESELKQNKKKAIPRIGLGDNVTIKKAIIDKDARIGNNVKIENKKKIKNKETDNYMIKDGIVIIPKAVVIPDGTEI